MISDGLAVEFAVREDDCPAAAITGRVGASVTCSPPPQLRLDGNVLLRLETRTDGPAVAEALDRAEDTSHVFLTESDRGHTVRCLSMEPCVLHTLTNAGFLPETVRYDEGVGRFSGAVVGRDVLRNVLLATGEAVGVSVVNIQNIDPEDEPVRTVPSRGWSLTPAQEDALRTGHDLGYFAVPKAVTAAEVADEMDLSKSAYLQRVQRAQAALFDQIFETGTD